MKKKDLISLALLGISSGLSLTSCNQKEGHSNYKGVAAEQMSPDMQSFYSNLAPDVQRKFMELDAQHRMMAMEMANQSCSGKNKCAGIGGCGTSEHSCAGKNACQSQGGTVIRDPNKAVEVQYRNQINERQKMNRGMNGSH